MLTSTKVGRALGLTKGTICNLAKAGRIPFIQLPSGHRRFDLEEVKAALSSDVMAAAFLPSLEKMEEEKARRVLRDMWQIERKKIEATPPGEEHDRALWKLDDEYEKADNRIRAQIVGSSIFEKGEA